MLWGQGHWLELNKRKSYSSVFSLLSMCQTLSCWGDGGAERLERDPDMCANQLAMLETACGALLRMPKIGAA